MSVFHLSSEQFTRTERQQTIRRHRQIAASVAVGLIASITGLAYSAKVFAVDPFIDSINGIECPGKPVDYTVQTGDRAEVFIRREVDPEHKFDLVDLESEVRDMNPGVQLGVIAAGQHIKMPAANSCNP